MIVRALILPVLAGAIPCLAFADTVLRFPEGSTRGFEESSTIDTLNLPIGPYSQGRIESTTVEGTVSRQVWKTPGSSTTETLGLLQPLRSQLEDAGYRILFECATKDCGGFDFRFKADVVEEPEMHVDLGDFRFLSATKTIEGEEKYVSLLVSRSPERGFVQVTTVGDGFEPPEETVASTKRTSPDEAPEESHADSLIARLDLEGATILEGLEFQKGSANLSGSPSAALRELAQYLAANPKRHVVLVGHTDSSGTLEGNVKLSRRRAESVMKRLIDTYGANPEQLTAEGIGYLSPVASNATREGRDKNRRVEAVISSF